MPKYKSKKQKAKKRAQGMCLHTIRTPDRNVTTTLPADNISDVVGLSHSLEGEFPHDDPENMVREKSHSTLTLARAITDSVQHLPRYDLIPLATNRKFKRKIAKELDIESFIGADVCYVTKDCTLAVKMSIFGKPVGVAFVDELDFDPFEIYDEPKCIQYIHIAPIERRKGYGSMMLEFISGRYQLLCHPLIRNDPFFVKNGYKSLPVCDTMYQERFISNLPLSYYYKFVDPPGWVASFLK